MQARTRLVALLLLTAVLLAGLVTQHVANATHPRPIGATPIRAALVPSYEPCWSPNGTHPRLANACLPPVQESDYLTVGSPDANGQPAKSSGSVLYKVLVGVPGPPDDSDVQIEIDITDVRNASDLSDYTGELRATPTAFGFPFVRITDHRAVPSGGGSSSAGTAVESSAVFGVVDFPCTATADTTVGSTCSVSTTANSIFPGGGIIVDGKRTIVQKGSLWIEDGGADGVAGTGVNTVFMTEGVFVP